MFWRKNKKPVALKPVTARIQVMPEVFYGGRDPEIHFRETKDKAKTGKSVRETRWEGAGEGIAEFLRKKWVRYTGLAVIFLLAVAVISLYYLQQAGIINLFKKKAEPAAVVEVKSEEKKSEVKVEEIKPVEATSTVATTTPAEEAPAATPSLVERELEFPQIFLANSADVDNDSLTDIEEEVFQTDSGTWDTDADGYYDGQEVLNLYNPKGTAPMKIIDSGLAGEYVNPVWQYRLYYPLSWQVGAVDPEANQILVSALTGDFVEISAFKKGESETFQDWFARKANGQKYSDLESFTNRFQESGFKRQDELAAYFTEGNNVYVLIYHPGTTGFISFRQVMNLFIQSFRPSKTLTDIPPQPVLP